MFNVRADRHWPGFAVEPRDDVPGFRVREDGLPLFGIAPQPMPSLSWGDAQAGEEPSMTDLMLRTGGPIGPYPTTGLSDRFAGNPYWSPERGSINPIVPAGHGSRFAPVARLPPGEGMQSTFPMRSDSQVGVHQSDLPGGTAPSAGRPPNTMVPPDSLILAQHRSDRAPTPSPGSNIDTVPGEVVVLPDGSTIADVKSPTGYVMSPKADLRDAASRGRQIGETYRAMLTNPATGQSALVYLAAALGLDLGQGGVYDHQRRGNMITGYTQLPQFRPIANINVGLIGQQAGLTLEEILGVAKTYARLRSSNADPGGLYGLDRRTLHYITRGYEIGQSGMFDPTDRR